MYVLLFNKENYMGVGNDKKLTGMIFPITLLVISISLTVGLYFYNSYLKGENIKIKLQLEDVESKMAEVKKDPNLQIYNLITNNQKAIDTLALNSQVTKFISDLNNMEDQYGLTFEGFNYVNGVISTKVSNSAERSLEPYKTISDFIRDFRIDKKAPFSLPFISQISGSSQMAMNVDFTVRKQFVSAIETTDVKKNGVNTNNKANILKKAEDKKAENVSGTGEITEKTNNPLEGLKSEGDTTFDTNL